MIRYRHNGNYNDIPFVGEINTKPSATLPDMSMTIPEILARYAHGLGFPDGKVPIYDYDESDDHDEEEEFPDLNTMDLAERQEYIEEVLARKNERDLEAKKALKMKMDEEKSILDAKLKKLTEYEKAEEFQKLKDRPNSVVEF